jgi:CBS-domain-containing membrane protein
MTDPASPAKRHHGPAKTPAFMAVVWSWIGAALGIGLVATFAQWLSRPAMLMLIGSYGASAVLVYGAPRSPFAQPRNLLGGHLLSAVIGVAACKLFPESTAIAASFAVATAIAAMQLTRTLHPPGGATALIAVIGPEQIQALGWLYPLPVVFGALILLAVALLVNNLPAQRHYPEHWL